MSAIDGTTSDDILNGTTSDDYLYAKSGNDKLYGNLGQDTLEGHEGNDTLYGDNDSDLLRGGVGNDSLHGGDGNDTMYGGQRGSQIEVDSLTGEVGQDLFVLGTYHGNFYSQGGNSDYAIITDFEKGQDRVLLDEGSYRLETSPIAGRSGTAIYSGSELIGILEGVDSSGLAFGDNGFTTILSLHGETSISNDVVVEAESLELDGDQVEDYGAGEQLIRLGGRAASGTASLTADSYDLSGAYDLSIDYFDESDGQANLEVFINGSSVGTWILDEDSEGRLASESNRRTHTLEGLAINSGDTIEIVGTSDGTEWARIDNLVFSPVTVENRIGSLTAGVTETGSLNADNTVDTYSFQLSAAGNLDLDLSATSGSYEVLNMPNCSGNSTRRSHHQHILKPSCCQHVPRLDANSPPGF
ncbi:MAG: hypothetical protein ACFB4I_10940 [Cyanophyceae cyanobacterium]